MAESPKTAVEMIAEGLREVGVLLLIFGVLDAILEMEPGEQKLGWTLIVLGSGVLLFVLGVRLEMNR